VINVDIKHKEGIIRSFEKEKLAWLKEFWL